MDRRLTRSRWAAIGAAVAVTLGGGGLIGVSAASGDAASFVSVDPTRILDTRTTTKVDDSTALLQVTGEVTTYSAAGASASKTLVIPATATAVAVNVTVTQGERNGDYGFVTAYPCDAATDEAPSASTLNFVEGVDVANGVVVPLGDDGAMCLSVYGAAHLIVDVSGYYTAASAGAVDAYTKAETDDLLDDKADAASVYTATETDDLLDAKADATSVYSRLETYDRDRINELLDERIDKGPILTTHSLASVVPSGRRYDSACGSSNDVNGAINNSNNVGFEYWYTPSVRYGTTAAELQTCNIPVQGQYFLVPISVASVIGPGLDNNSSNSLSQIYLPYMADVCLENTSDRVEATFVSISAVFKEGSPLEIMGTDLTTDGCRTLQISNADIDALLARVVDDSGAVTEFDVPIGWQATITIKRADNYASDTWTSTLFEGLSVAWKTLADFD